MWTAVNNGSKENINESKSIAIPFYIFH